MSADNRSGWLAAAGHIVGSLTDWSICYDWDGQTYPTRAAAITEHPAEDRADAAGALYKRLRDDR